MNMHDDIPDSDDLLAAEYVLGLLPGAEMAQTRKRLGADAAFAALVDAWEQHFAPWLQAVAPVDAPATAWPRIQSGLWQHELPTRASTALAAPVITTASAETPGRGLLDRLAFWRWLAAGGFAVAAASVAALMVTLSNLPEAPGASAPVQVVTAPPAAPADPVIVPAAMPMTASLLHEDGSAAYNAVVNPDTGVIVLVPVHMPDDARVPELWLIGGDGQPKSLGVVHRHQAMRLVLPDAMRGEAHAQSVFAVSLEPEGGSPTGLPTGPVVAQGSLTQL